jgi:adenosylcobyric acid synthase
MVVGTSSSVGKSLVVTALCRILRQDGWSVAPFKAQNMSLNAYVTAAGGEMGYAQALQAWAAGVAPHVDMNPILLKPQGNMSSQIVLNGQPVGIYRAGDYYESFFERGWQEVRLALDRLTPAYDWTICEGAGSPAEVNLRHRDLTNMRVAQYLNAPTLLVADIDRGGALAHVVGTLQVLPEEERRLFAGIVINKFRGVLDLLQPGLDWLQSYTGLPIVGVLPWLEFALPAEDSMSLFEPRSRPTSAELEIAVIRLPHIANFTDFDPLRAEPSVRLRYVALGEPLGSPDAVILPGSKATIADLLALQTSGLAAQIQTFTGAVVGICGGLQMLGSAIADPDGYEGHQGTYAGLELLPSTTTLTAAKVTQQVITASRWLGEHPIAGYEIHQGRTRFGQETKPIFEQEHLGCRTTDGRVWGSYLHGLFDNHAWRRHWLNRLRANRGLPPLPILEGHYSSDRDRLLDRLADTWRSHLDLSLLGYSPAPHSHQSARSIE